MVLPSTALYHSCYQFFVNSTLFPPTKECIISIIFANLCQRPSSPCSLLTSVSYSLCSFPHQFLIHPVALLTHSVVLLFRVSYSPCSLLGLGFDAETSRFIVSVSMWRLGLRRSRSRNLKPGLANPCFTHTKLLKLVDPH